MKRFTQKKKLLICKKVINHWVTNLFLAYFNDLHSYDTDSNKCEFCKHFKYTCKYCPLNIYDKNCDDYNSAWGNVQNAIGLDRLIPAVENMLITLEIVCDKWLEE